MKTRHGTVDRWDVLFFLLGFALYTAGIFLVLILVFKYL
jgi:hypothetical protein